MECGYQIIGNVELKIMILVLLTAKKCIMLGFTYFVQIAAYFVQIATSSKIYINILLKDWYIASQ